MVLEGRLNGLRHRRRGAATHAGVVAAVAGLALFLVPAADANAARLGDHTCTIEIPGFSPAVGTFTGTANCDGLNQNAPLTMTVSSVSQGECRLQEWTAKGTISATLAGDTQADSFTLEAHGGEGQATIVLTNATVGIVTFNPPPANPCLATSAGTLVGGFASSSGVIPRYGDLETVSCSLSLASSASGLSGEAASGIAACNTNRGLETGRASLTSTSVTTAGCGTTSSFTVTGTLAIALPSKTYTTQAGITGAAGRAGPGEFFVTDTGQSGPAAWDPVSAAECSVSDPAGTRHPWAVTASFTASPPYEAFSQAPLISPGVDVSPCETIAVSCAGNLGVRWYCAAWGFVQGHENSFALGNCHNTSFVQQTNYYDRSVPPAGAIFLNGWFGGSNLDTCGWVQFHSYNEKRVNGSATPAVDCQGHGRHNSSFIATDGYGYMIWQTNTAAGQNGYPVNLVDSCWEYANDQPWTTNGPSGHVELHDRPAGYQVYVRYRTKYVVKDNAGVARYWYLVADPANDNQNGPRWVFMSGKCVKPPPYPVGRRTDLRVD